MRNTNEFDASWYFPELATLTSPSLNAANTNRGKTIMVPSSML